MEQIKIKIDLLGRPTITGEGFIGTACDAKMKPIEDAFKGKSVRSNRPEYDMIIEETNESEHLTL